MSSVLPLLNRHKKMAVDKQTAYGKDFSNPLMADNLPKIVGFSTHLASWLRVGFSPGFQTVLWFINATGYGNEALDSPKANGVCCDAEEMRYDHKDKECSQEVLGYNPQKLNQKKLEVNK
ncbi:hypothetical protein Tco_0750692 [Tanacetum coccineum]|uniref:Uncharacterized protein n=1 Tax=Tanacetum coccineum TaxID=301880 RepID=A0ABQ4Z4J7_9ASTR